jgi:hypothetical protein
MWVGLVVDKAALEQVFSEYFDSLLHIHHDPSLRAGTKEWPTYHVGILTPPKETKKNYSLK